jgi:hypothetical protein
MFKRTLMGAGLGLALLGGTATAVHTYGSGNAHAATVQTDLKVVDTAPQATDTDPTAPCAVDASGVETGDCQNSQNATGPEDSAATSESDTAQ